MKAWDGRSGTEPLAGTVTVPSGTGVVNVTAPIGVTLPSSSYVVVCTPNSLQLSSWMTSAYTATNFNVSVQRAAAGTYVMRWVLVLL